MSEQVATSRKGPAARARIPALIGAAEAIFLAKGYHAATMADIAKAAGMSKKTVYTMVDSKAELFAGLLAHHQNLLDYPVAEPDWSAREILIAHCTALARFLLSPGQIAILRLIMAEYTHSPELGRIFLRSRVNAAKTRLESCIAGIAASQGGQAGDVKEMAAMLFGMAIGEFHLGVLIGFRSAPGRRVLERRVCRAVDIFLRGCVLEAAARRP